MNASQVRAQEALSANRFWYHTIELAPGVVTPGQVDLRGIAAKLLPEDLSGRRALDVGTFDGFWAFELERRGAETVAIDVDAVDAAEWPPINRPKLEAQAKEWELELGRGFRLAHEALGSRVERVTRSVYELDADAIGGPVDVIFSGAILLHLRDPVRALERMLGALRPGGELILLEPFSIRDTIFNPRRPAAFFKPFDSEFTWWYPNLSALKGWPWVAGFVEVKLAGFHRPRARNRLMRGWMAGIKARSPASR